MRRKIRCTFALLTLAGIALAAQATTLVYMDLDQLTAAAPVVARVRCLGNETRWEGGEIYTFTTFEVVDSLKGTPPLEITVRLIGGRVGNLISKVEGVPRFESSEEAFLFLGSAPNGDWTVTSWVQGTFRIRRDPHTQQESVTQDTAMVAVFDPQTQKFRAGGVRHLSVAQFKMRVAEALERQREARRP